MNIEALIEDMEAQGYFAASKDEREEHLGDFCQQVLVTRKDLVDVYLSLPLLGKNFIAGFNAKNTKSVWLIVQNYQFLVLQDEGTRLQRAKLSLKTVLRSHLIGVLVRVGITGASSELIGYVIRVRGENVEFVSLAAQRILIPLLSLTYVVVEKLSIETKV